MRRSRWLTVAVPALLAGLPAGAFAQAPATYGGGRLDGAALRGGYHPTVGVVLAPRGGDIAVHIDTSLRCGRDVYLVRAHRIVPAGAGQVAASGRARLRLGRGRIVWHWSLTATFDGRLAAGIVTIAGRRRVGGRVTSCSRAPTRAFRALAASPPGGAASTPLPGGAYLGTSDVRLAGGVPAPVVLRVAPRGRKVFARWTVNAPCRRGPAERLTNLTPPTPVSATGGFRRSERFNQRFSDALVRYRASFGGRFTTDGALGTLRLRARVYDRSGRHLLSRCDSGTRSWHVLLDSAAELAAPAPPAQGSPAPSPGAWDPDRFITAGAWSLTMTSDTTDGIAHGQSFSYSTADGPSYGKASPTFIELAYPNDAGNWDALFRPPPGQTFGAGTTYTDSERYTDPAGPPRTTAMIEISGLYTGCDTSTGSFTVETLTFDPNGAPRTVRVRFEHHCEGQEGALRGVWDFHAP